MNDAHDAFVERELTRHFEAKPDKIWIDQIARSSRLVRVVLCGKDGPPVGDARHDRHEPRAHGAGRARDRHGSARTELVAYVDDAEGPPEDMAALLRWVGRLPFEQNPPTFLGWGHTIPLGRPQFAQSLLTTVFTINPLVRPDEGTIFRVGDDPISLLWTTFLTDAEYALKKARGENTILDLFAANKHPVALARSRPSYV